MRKSVRRFFVAERRLSLSRRFNASLSSTVAPRRRIIPTDLKSALDNYLITGCGGGGFITWMFGRIPIREGGRPMITPPEGLFEGGLLVDDPPSPLGGLSPLG